MRADSSICTLLLAVALALPCGAWAVETGDITLTEGYVDRQSGVRVDKVEKDPNTGIETITLSVPRKYGDIYEIVVKGKRPPREEVKQRRQYQRLDRDDKDYYGYVVYLGEHEDVPVRLYMDSRQQQPGKITPP